MPKILFVWTFYPEFLDEIYDSDETLPTLEYEQQLQRLLGTAFGSGDAYLQGMRAAGCDARNIIVNADRLQAAWAGQHGLALTGNIHDQRRRIVAAQIEDYRPDVLYVFEWCPLGDAFLAKVKSCVRLLVGQIASPLPADRTFAAYDLMVSSYPPIVDHFRAIGTPAEHCRLGFDERILERLAKAQPRYDVTFIGGFAPSHPNRPPWLEGLLDKIDIDIFGYGLSRARPDSPIHAHHHGPVWGWRMYEVLQQSRITLNMHSIIDIGGKVVTGFANNMRLYEATGVGTCLVTEQRANLPDMFEPGREVITYTGESDCVEKVRYYLSHEPQRAAIARAGQQRTLDEHTYTKRMENLLDLLRRRL